MLVLWGFLMRNSLIFLAFAICAIGAFLYFAKVARNTNFTDVASVVIALMVAAAAIWAARRPKQGNWLRASDDDMKAIWKQW